MMVKGYERDRHIDTDCADGNVVSSMVPWLLSKIEELDGDFQGSDEDLDVWLAAGFPMDGAPL
jgi:hypothetical protein